jgi:hypothetical protein
VKTANRVSICVQLAGGFHPTRGTSGWSKWRRLPLLHVLTQKMDAFNHLLEAVSISNINLFVILGKFRLKILNHFGRDIKRDLFLLKL